MHNLKVFNLSFYEEKLQEIIETEAITSVFQPIVSLRDGSILGYEALSRGPQGTEMENPEMLFRVAEQCKSLWDLERLCRSKALSAMQHSESNATLFLNVHPSVIEDSHFQKGFTKEYLNKFGINPDKIIFEITEKCAVSNVAEFKEIIQYYKGQDYKIAIDDAGAGYSGLNLILDVMPHYLKLDMKLIRDIDKDNVKKALVKGMYEFSKITGTNLIAEGIETVQELETLIHIGVHYGQGFYIQKPTSEISSVSLDIVRTINDLNMEMNDMHEFSLSDIHIGNLCFRTVSIDEDVTIQEAYEMLVKYVYSQGFCITKNGIVQGVVTRNMINSAVAGVYGYSLHSRKSIATIMDHDFLALDYHTPVNVAGRLAMDRPDEKVYDFITVTAAGKYYGIVTIKDLLNKTIEIEVTNAKQLNPLTLLPGNILIEKALSNVLHSKQTLCVLYFDIDNFKAYNDVYGFENGDCVIKYLAKSIIESVPDTNFVGHVGGDDFVAVVEAKTAEEICRFLIKSFDESITTFYTPMDVNRGYISTKNRQGKEEQYPLISLSIAGVMICDGRFADIFALTAESSRVKKECKTIPGSAYIIL